MKKLRVLQGGSLWAAVFCLFSIFSLGAFPLSAAAKDYVDRPDVTRFVAEMSARHGFRSAEMLKVLAAAERQQSALDAISRPAEKTLNWGQYGKIFLKPRRFRDGAAFWQKHRRTLQRAAQTYGTPPEIIVSIMGVETRYGNIMGNYRTLDALATLAFDYPPRARFFREQLGEYFLLVREYGFDPLALKSSYAGAMGYGQFIPSSYRNYAVDFDGDGTADLLGNPIDAIGSIGNYLKRHGWRDGEMALIPARITEAFSGELKEKSSRPKRDLAYWRAQGIVPKAADAPQDMLAVALEFQTEDGPEYWFGLHNFYVLTRYNRSHLYVMAVHHLAQEIRARRIELRRARR